jgi:raffinose/stachyose/melibiose transport system substrate-binding protein
MNPMALSTTARRLGVAALVAAVSVTALVGCSGTSSKAGDKVTLSMSIQDPDPKTSDPQLIEAIAQFEKQNPNVTITLTGEAVADHLQKLQVAAQSNTLPDIFWIYDANARELQKAGKLMDIRPTLESADLLKSYPQTTIDAFTAGKVMYGQPSGGLVTGLWYNKQILDANGLKPPVTYDDFLADAKALKAKGITTIANGANQSAFSCWSFLRDLSNFGWDDKVDGLISGKTKYNNPDFAKLYKHIDELRQAGAFSDNVSTQTYAQAVAQFTGGGAAFLDAGIWAASDIQKSSFGKDAGFWIGPEFADGVGDQQIVINVPAAPYAYSAKSAQDPAKADAMKKWIVYWAGKDSAQIQLNHGLPPSTNYDDIKAPADQTVFQTAITAAFATGNKVPKNQPDLMVSTQVATAMYDSIYGVIQGQMTPDAAMDHVQQALDAK